MESEEEVGLLDALSVKVEAGWRAVDPDRRTFLDGLRHLQLGEVEEASRIFRRAARKAPAPFATMSRMAQGRCEVVRGHRGVALRIFKSVATSQAPPELKKLAWMEVADLARGRGDAELLERAIRGAQTMDG